MSRRYRYCGLVLDTDIPLPELPEAAATAAVDLVVRRAAVPAALPAAVCREVLYEHDGREALWRLDGIAHYRVAEAGRRIDVDAAPLADEAAVRLFLLQPVFALACILRGDWLLNAAAVERGGEVVAFVGPSGCGKSTAAALIPHGFRLVGDSLLRISRDGQGRMLAHPQAPWLWLWPDALRALRLGDAGIESVRPGVGLRRLPLPMAEGPAPIVRIGLLREQRGNDPGLFEPASRTGGHTMETLLRQIAGSLWLEALASRAALFQWSSALADAVRFDRLDIPWGEAHLPTLGEQLRQWCERASAKR